MKKACLIGAAGVIAAGLPAVASAGSVQVFSSLGDLQAVTQSTSGTLASARLKTDLTNWDMRLDADSDPNPGDDTANLTNNRGVFNTALFNFEMSYDATSKELTWSVSDDNLQTPAFAAKTLTLDFSAVGSVNTIQLTSSARPNGGNTPVMDIEGLSFVSGSMNLGPGDLPDMDAAYNGSQFFDRFLFFGNGANLLSGDWMLSGTADFGGLVDANPNERLKFEVRLSDTAVVPTPAAAWAGLALLGGLLGRRKAQAGREG